jgi:hypothetical protein
MLRDPQPRAAAEATAASGSSRRADERVDLFRVTTTDEHDVAGSSSAFLDEETRDINTGHRATRWRWPVVRCGVFKSFIINRSNVLKFMELLEEELRCALTPPIITAQACLSCCSSGMPLRQRCVQHLLRLHERIQPPNYALAAAGHAAALLAFPTPDQVAATVGIAR